MKNNLASKCWKNQQPARTSILLLPITEYVSYPESNIEPTIIEPKKSFQNKGSQISRKRDLEIGFCKYSIS